ncbi:hypothetical protein AWENTII_008661 [Aspergillus wentii]|nr:hypothetical protein MW887_005332 [Aspergillus wentii]
MASLVKPSRANPLAFTRWPVTLITTTVYFALVIPLLVIHHVVPSAPKTSPSGLNITEAWGDLQALTNGYHPYNSHQNDKVHEWLLTRINEIIDTAPSAEEYRSVGEEKPDVFTFDDTQSNLSFTGSNNVGIYFEGTNIIVYVRGSEDDQTRWWEDPNGTPAGKGGVLVNAHYDSVSTGFGATDDGIGVITCLQLIKYFTTPGHVPRRGLVVLFNNGEEDYLNGARVYSQHPISKLPHTFLNLEGTGAGGRATLFRSSDAEVTRPYMGSKHPFGSVLSANGFQMGLIRSQTDYVVFEGDMGLRGLDVAFIEPRARYHTDQDDARHTNKDSLWHMLSGAVATTHGLVSDSSNEFDGPARDDGKVPSGSGNQAVWFDLFGSTFVVFRLHTLFALSVTLLIVAPLTLILTSVALTRADKMYLFRSSAKSEDIIDGVPLLGLRGFFRFPFLFVIPTAVTVGLAYLLTKINPFIIHSSEYAVWTMMVAAWTFLAWFVSRVADFARPSAFHRVYTLTWMFVLTWVLMVIATTYENKYGLAGGYFIFFTYAGVFLATWISYLELFSLPRKSEYANQHGSASRLTSSHENRFGSTSGHENEDDADAEEEATETTSLLRNGNRTTFANYVRVGGSTADLANEEEEEVDPNVYANEQSWSSSMPKWTWLLQFILISPIVIIMVGPIALLLTTALHQTGQDGSSSLFIYLSIAAFTTLLLTPLIPFVHRYTYHIPVFLLLIFTGTLIYNLAAFPFSETSRLKVFFIQRVDLDTGVNRASLTGVTPFVSDIIQALPSAAGKNVSCEPLAERFQCSWEGLEPHVTGQKDEAHQDWLSFNVNKTPDKSQARFEITGQNTRACKLLFDTSVSEFHVAGSAYDPRFPHSSSDGTREIRLWSRTWDRTWTVDVEWAEDTTLEGRVVCLWSDDNQIGAIPALDEIRQFSPGWAAMTKFSDGLVEASRAFHV